MMDKIQSLLTQKAEIEKEIYSLLTGGNDTLPVVRKLDEDTMEISKSHYDNMKKTLNKQNEEILRLMSELDMHTKEVDDLMSTGYSKR